MNKILEVENLVFKYEKESDVNELNGVSFSITKGEWVSIIGQNGSGKSTTARLIDGLFEEFGGKVKIDGELLTAENVWNLRRKIGMVFQIRITNLLGQQLKMMSLLVWKIKEFHGRDD